MGFATGNIPKPKISKESLKKFLRDSLEIYYIQESIKEVNNHFENNLEKVEAWFLTDNPLLGNIKPGILMMTGRSKKLYQFIKNLKEGHTP